MMKKTNKIKWLKLVMILPLTAMLMGLVSIKTQPEAHFLSKETTKNLLNIRKQIKAAQDSIQVNIKVERTGTPVHYEYVSGLNNGKITAQIGQLKYEIGDISNKDEYQNVLEMLDVFKDNTSFNKKYEV